MISHVQFCEKAAMVTVKQTNRKIRRIDIKHKSKYFTNRLNVTR